MDGPIIGLTRETDAFVGKGLMGQVAPPQQGLSTSSAQLTANQQREISSFLSFNRIVLANFLKANQLTPLGPNPTESQRETALRDLFAVIKCGGSGGIKYESGTGRIPRTPRQMLATMRGDCDELSRLFIALAKELNIPLTGISMGTMRFNTSKPGTQETEPHAAIFAKGLSGRNYVFDMAFRSIDQVPDFSIPSLSKIYVGLRIAQGRALANFPIRSIASTNDLSALQDVVAHHFIDSANFHALRVFNNAKTKAQDMAFAFSDLQQVKKLAPTNPAMCMEAFSVADSLGDNAFSNKGYALATELYSIALFSFGNAPKSDRDAKKTEVYDTRLGLAMSYEMRGKHEDAFHEYDALMRLNPANENAYKRAYDMAITLAKRPKTPIATVRKHAARAYIIARDAVNGLPAGDEKDRFVEHLRIMTQYFVTRRLPTP